MSSKSYIYKNIRTGQFSIMNNGKVIQRGNDFIVDDASFIVRPAGHKKAVESKQRNVHAFITINQKFIVEANYKLPDNVTEIKYNPFLNSFFMCDGKPIFTANRVYFKTGRCYTVLEN